MSPMQKEKINELLIALGSAYRADWSFADGREIEDQIEVIRALFISEEDFDVEEVLKKMFIKKTEKYGVIGYGWE